MQGLTASGPHSGSSGTVNVVPCVPTTVSSLSEDSLGHFFLERGKAKKALERLTAGLCLQFVGDSAVLIDCFLGKAATSAASDMKRSLSVAHVGLQTLIQCFDVRPPSLSDMAHHVPRSDNSAADAAANWALDVGTFEEVRLDSLLSMLHDFSNAGCNEVGMLFSFDGAARGNPGPSASGVCAW